MIWNKLFERDVFGNSLFLKRVVIGFLAAATFGRINIWNKLKVAGWENLDNLPEKNVLFISNHQTYYADVIAIYHAFSAHKWGFRKIPFFPIYMFAPRINVYYVAAEETMYESGWIPKIFALTGAVTVRRSWRHKGQEVNRAPDKQAPEKIKKALESGWVIHFPQGTTSPYAIVRKGTAHLIKEFKPVVVPIVINGFRRAFDKKGLRFKKTNTQLSITFKTPWIPTDGETLEAIQERIIKLIEQEKPFILQQFHKDREDNAPIA
ncbi:MAG: 1-acyl-sn-glycerol-3-phosphate acyltransferase [Cytophagales bacterium]|nr:1-acyl-sn-glycerol-3-phosphate acyltransferase [Cytophagales bacterium]MDW8383556.1 lysophospholipid acyltransferase family protein [Flammeovirgaceae bacterium]